jgi:hypothetical protein
MEKGGKEMEYVKEIKLIILLLIFDGSCTSNGQEGNIKQCRHHGNVGHRICARPASGMLMITQKCRSLGPSTIRVGVQNSLSKI